MELVRNTCRKSLLLYKASIQTSIRNSSSKITVPPDSTDACLKESKLTDFEPKLRDPRIFNALVSTDELSSYLGLVREFAIESEEIHPYLDKLKRIQMILFDLRDSILKSKPGNIKTFGCEHIEDLKEWITEFTSELPSREDYIIPGGGKASASLHIARAICKKTEFNIEPLVKTGILDKEVQNYLQILADFLLTTSRIAAKYDKRSEVIYIPRAETPKKT